MSTTKTRGRTKILDRDGERQLAIAWLEDRNYEARNKLILAYRPMAVSMAGEVSRGTGVELDDLVQEAFIALAECLDSFDPARGFGFGTFARWHIKGSLHRHVMDVSGPTRLGTNRADKKVFMGFRRLRAEIEARTGQPLDDAGRREIAQKIGVPLEAVIRMEPRLARKDLALDRAPSEDDGENLAPTLADEGPSPEAAAVDRIDAANARTLLKQLIAELPERQQAILKARVMREDRVQLSELGAEFGVTLERVRQLERSALRQLRRALERRGYAAEDLIHAA